MQNGCVRTKKDRIRLRLSWRTAASEHGRSYAITCTLPRTYWSCKERRETRVGSKLTCPVYGARDLSGSSCRVCQPRAEIVARTVGLGSMIGWSLDRGVGFFWRRASTSVSISRPSA